ncbi:3-hydroxyacyl-[acyl-carrier-protein] dehydratase FabZ, partial [Acinetobacter baumannii]
MAALPHRYPMLWVDRVEDLILDRSITAIKAVTINEQLFQGHFPGRPI